MGIPKTVVRKKSQNTFSMNTTYTTVQKQVKSKQHIRDTYIDERTIHKNMGIINKKIQNVYLMWCVWKEETNEGF